jgi:hypothetical protein
MTTTSHARRAWALVALLTVVTPTALSGRAWAQEAPTPNPNANPNPNQWQRGTTLTAFGGVGTASSETDASVGLALGWEPVPHLAIEGRGIWFDTNEGSSAFTAMLEARVPLRPGRRFNPYGAAGVGLFRATFNSSATDIPDFYRQRMDAGAPQVGTFDDFELVFGGGVDFFVSQHWSLRPEGSALVVFGGGDSRTVGLFGVTVAYHFEPHLVTSSVVPRLRR